MKVELPVHNDKITTEIPETTSVFKTSYPVPLKDPVEMVLESIRYPLESPSLTDKLRDAMPESVVIVVSDITRPVPYATFLGELISEIESAGVSPDSVTILIATGMHRPSTREERLQMFGAAVCDRYRIVDHRAEAENELVTLSGESHSGRPIQLNKIFMEAGFRIITGLVEPHFMAGFSGGRKAVCPGLSSLETVKAFHSFGFLDHPAARNGNLTDNPLHAEALSIAEKAGVDFCINLIVNKEKELVAAVSGDLIASHQEACTIVRRYACPPKSGVSDVVITSCGGYPLDATFYQCVKGMIAALPLVRKNGIIIALGGCSEGIGSREYRDLLFTYADRWEDFVHDFRDRQDTRKDQWEFQMQTKVLSHIGQQNLIFITGGIPESELGKLSVNGIYADNEDAGSELSKQIRRFAAEGKSISVIPEGPYCTPF